MINNDLMAEFNSVSVGAIRRKSEKRKGKKDQEIKSKTTIVCVCGFQ